MNNFESESEKIAAQAIYINREEFNTYLKLSQRIDAIKALKAYSGLGLKESKDAIDKFWVGELKSYILEDRKLKLERLAKKPLVEEIVINIKNIDDEAMKDLFMKLSVDVLLSIDELFVEENK